jgi:hypothetical protein
LVLTYSLLDVWSIALNQTKHRRWIDLDTSFLHHFGEIAVADAILAVPPYTQRDDLDGKAALEKRQHSGSLVSRSG